MKELAEEDAFSITSGKLFATKQVGNKAAVIPRELQQLIHQSFRNYGVYL
jgi:hypothetical protein